MRTLSDLERFSLIRSVLHSQSTATEPDDVCFVVEPSGATPFDLEADFIHTPAFVVIGEIPSSGARINIQQKAYWPVGTRRPERWLSLPRFEASQDDLGLPGEPSATMSPWAALWEQPQADGLAMRGVFAPHYKKKAMFSDTMVLKTAELGRHKPHIRITHSRVLTLDE